MQMDTRSLLMNYVERSRANNVQLTFDALLVRRRRCKDSHERLAHICAFDG